MTEQLPAGGDRLRTAAERLLAAFGGLGAEHQALAAEENEATSKERRGTLRRPLFSPGTPDEKLYEVVSYVQVAVQRLSEAYEPTKKHPGLATARRPQEMRTVLSGLRTALTGLCDELVAHGPAQDAAEFEASITLLRELENRTCREVPAQAAGPTAAEATTAILADPEIARAAAAALERAGV